MSHQIQYELLENRFKGLSYSRKPLGCYWLRD